MKHFAYDIIYYILYDIVYPWRIISYNMHASYIVKVLYKVPSKVKDLLNNINFPNFSETTQ